MKRILNPIQIQRACVKVSCGADQGTAFYVSDNYLLTAYHIVVEASAGDVPILIHTSDGTESCSIGAIDLENDVCILIDANKGGGGLPLLAAATKVNEKCSIFGYPHQGQSIYLALEGKIVQVLINEKSDFVVGNLNIDGSFDYGGLSGSPVTCNGSVTGVVLRQADDRIAAVSIKKLNTFLQTNKCTVEEEYLHHNIPLQFADEIKTATPNYAVLEKIEEATKNPGSWFLLQGSPGSGKSTLVASFEPDDENILICGRYFIKVPNDPDPIVLKTSPGFFLETIENLIGTTITGFPLAKDESTFEDRVKRMPSLMRELGAYLEEKGQTGIIVVDGLDEVKNLDEFLGVLPVKLPVQIKVILSCTSKDILPVAFKNELGDQHIIQVTPIDPGQCEKFIADNVNTHTLPVPIVQQIAAKSEGHALYLRYLTNYINTQELGGKEMELEEWVEAIPVIGGDISNYYNSIWEPISKVPDKLWLLIILSQLRQPVTKEELFGMLPEPFQLSFNTYFPGIRFLLNDNGKVIEIYHNSFKDYAISKTTENIKQANDFIAAYCETHPQSRFSTSNRLYHYASGSHPENAIAGCNQQWADDCAILGISPDLVIADIKKVTDLAIDQQGTIDLIRLLLLLQRIEFRYDSVFAENAHLISRALIATGKFDQALKYLVRENTLLVSNDDALLFLQLFYEHDATAEASTLLNAIDARYRRLIQEGMASGLGIDNGIFILRLNSLTLSMHADYESGLTKVMNLLGSLRNFQEAAREDGDESGYQVMYRTREHASAFQHAYMIRMYGGVPDSETVSKLMSIKLDDKWAGMRAVSAVLYNEFNGYNIPVIPKDEHYQSLIKDIEHLAKTYGYEEDTRTIRLLISALLEDSKDSALVSGFITKALEAPPEFQFREVNGVDLNYKEIHRLYFEFICRGYVDDTGNYPPILKKQPRHTNWQAYTTSLIQCIAFAEGRLHRLTADGKSSAADIKKLTEIFAAIDFTFDERSHWDRAYHLPESVFPIIYAKLSKLHITFHRPELDNLLSIIQRRSNDQLGLYSEGFRNCLYDTIKECIKGGVKKEVIIPVIDTWKHHTITGVQNRWERTPELLKIVEVYGLINEKELAQQAYLDMLQTSMGPGWYKESQFDLLNTLLAIKPDEGLAGEYLQQVAGMLDFASGEMTFQRYVRNEKETFVASISKQSALEKGIEYFKFEVLPPPAVLLFNAETFLTDAPRKGDGYAPGARNITEASAVLRILKSPMDPYLAWALCNIFTISDDTFRYVSDYGSHLCTILNKIEAGGGQFLQEIHQSIAGLASKEEMKEHRGQFLRAVSEGLTGANKQHLKGHLLAKEIPWGIADTDEDTRPEGKEQKEANAFTRFNARYEKDREDDRENLLTEGFEAFKKERISIWFANWSTESDKARKNLRSLLASDKEALSFFRDPVNKYDHEAWVMANHTLWFLKRLLSPAQVDEVYRIIMEHFFLLVHPDQRYLDKYSWLKESLPATGNDEGVAGLLIWLLNHPVYRISERAYESLVSLTVYNTSIVIGPLLREAISEKPSASAEQCSLLLKIVSENNAAELIGVLKKYDHIIPQIAGIRHFSIKKNFLDLSVNLNKAGYPSLYEAISKTIPKSVVLTGEVVFEEDYLESIAYEIYELNDIQILNREFSETLLSKVKEYCSPLSVRDYQRSDNYLQRSFYENKDSDIRFRQLIKYALNVAVCPRVDQNNFQEVYDILN